MSIYTQIAAKSEVDTKVRETLAQVLTDAAYATLNTRK